MATQEELKEIFDRATVSDYVRCRACDERRIQAGSNEDLCQPHNTPEDLLCPCGGIREPYECQSEEWITEGRVNSDPMARVVPGSQALAFSNGRVLRGIDAVVIKDESEILLHHPRGQIVYTPPVPASKAGSKGYQRRQNQRWPKGR